ncbi:MAG: hypothetical protein M1445_08655 [Bacteroidetes bacterium]|nr:hypothetical protein [Bacteroidota bacterium]MCL6102966.1 hypothetical protein [Bacteroidota bacterium]
MVGIPGALNNIGAIKITAKLCESRQPGGYTNPIFPTVMTCTIIVDKNLFQLEDNISADDL